MFWFRCNYVQLRIHLLTLLSIGWLSLAAQNGVDVELQVDQMQTLYFVQASCTNTTERELELSYVLQLEKKGKPIKARAGEFQLAPSGIFYMGPFAIPDQDSLTFGVSLKIYLADELIASDVFPKVKAIERDANNLSFDEDIMQSSEADPTLNFNPGVIIGVFVIQQTKTPWGQRFFELFAQQWQQLELETEYNIVIEEVPFRGIYTVITVKVDNQEVFAQILQPKYDYLFDLSSYAFQITVQDIQRRNQIGKDILLESKNDIEIY
ncbi:MAG: hypothetical protein HRU40_06140 [Saprospiraceae bacterium]|nr:hypothetical protein [Saprospiraceae bacterium]